MTPKQTAIALNGIDGKKMKAICAFALKDNALSILSTPFIYKKHLFATNQEVAVVIDCSSFLRISLDADKAYSLPAQILDKALARDVFYLSETSEGEKMLSKVGDSSAHLNNCTDKLSPIGDALLAMAQEKHDSEVNISSVGFAPALVKKVCALADAYNVSTMVFETVPQTKKSLPRLQVSFPAQAGVKALVMPKRL